MSELETLKNLAHLAAIDDELSGFYEELNAIPKSIAEMRESVDRLAEIVAGEQKQLSDAEKVLTGQSEDIATLQTSLANNRQKGAQAQNTREAEAAERERTGLRRLIKEREDEFLASSETIETVRTSVTSHASELATLRSDVSERTQKSEDRLAKLKEENASTEQRRREAVELLPKAVFKRYERVRIQRKSGVAKLIKETCQACRVRVPPQLAILIQRNEEVAQCPNCLRYLVHASLFPKDEALASEGEVPSAAAS